MFKFLYSILLCLSIFHAHASLTHIVLVEDYHQEKSQDSTFIFPCSLSAGGIFCDNRVMLADRRCARTLHFERLATSQISISCQLMAGEKIILARTLLGRAGGPVYDETAASAYYLLEFNTRITLLPVSSRQLLLSIH